MTDLIVDPERANLLDTEEYRGTGYFVRAKDAAGKWQSVDIVTLTKDSLTAWLRSRGGDNPWAESVVLGLLGHQQ